LTNKTNDSIMKIIFNIFLILLFLIMFVPPFRRFVFWLLVGQQLVKEQKKANRQSVRKEGEIKVERTDTNSSRFKGGDYVDYEEVKD
jgi:predicted membrane protein